MFRLARTATAILVAVVSGLAAPGVRAATESEAGARAVIAETVDEVLAVLRDKSRPTEDRIRSIEQIVYGRFDLYVMSRLVLARNWKRFSDEQKEQYVAEFKQYLTNSYGNRIERYDQQEVEIIGEREEPRGDVVVQTKILGGEFEGAVGRLSTAETELGLACDRRGDRGHQHGFELPRPVQIDRQQRWTRAAAGETQGEERRGDGDRLIAGVVSAADHLAQLREWPSDSLTRRHAIPFWDRAPGVGESFGFACGGGTCSVPV